MNTDGQLRNAEPRTCFQPDVSATQASNPRVLIVGEDGRLVEQLQMAILEKGIDWEHLTDITMACEAARTGEFPVVVTAPVLGEASWRQLVDLAARDELKFVTILVTRGCSSEERAAALDYGAYDVLEIPNELSRLTESLTCAIWAAYLMGSSACL